MVLGGGSPSDGSVVMSPRLPRDGVRAQPEPKRFQRQHTGRRHVADVDLRAELPHEPGLLALGRRLEDHLVLRDQAEAARDQVLPYPVLWSVETHSASLPVFGGGTA